MALPRGSLTAAELALGHQLRKSLTAILASPSPTAVVLPDARILLLNDAFLALTGYKRDELLGVPAWTLMPRHVASGARALSVRIVAAAERGHTSPADTYHRTLVLLAKGGGEIKVRASSVLLRSRNGSPRGFLTTFVEGRPGDRPPAPWVARLGSADARTLEAALGELPSFEDLPEPLALSSAEGVLLQVNRAYEAAYGWRNADVVGLPGADLLVSDLRTRADHRLEEILGAELLPRSWEPRIRHRDGRAIAVTASSVPVRAEDGSTRYIVTAVIPG